MKMNSRISSSQGQLLPTFNNTITIFNKLRAQDSTSNTDVWYKTILYNNTWTAKTLSEVSETTFNVSSFFVVRCPENSEYNQYTDWSKEPGIGFTFSVGDVVIKGEIEDPEDPEKQEFNTQQVNKLTQTHQPNAFIIKMFKDNTGAATLSKHYRIEGS